MAKKRVKVGKVRPKTKVRGTKPGKKKASTKKAGSGQPTLKLLGGAKKAISSNEAMMNVTKRALTQHYFSAVKLFESGNLPSGSYATRFDLFGIPTAILSNFKGHHPRAGRSKTVIVFEHDYPKAFGR